MVKSQDNTIKLSGDVLSLQDILSTKQTRGSFGEIQLRDIVAKALPSDSYSLQATLSNGKRPACLILLPNPPDRLLWRRRQSYKLIFLVSAPDGFVAAARVEQSLAGHFAGNKRVERIRPRGAQAALSQEILCLRSASTQQIDVHDPTMSCTCRRAGLNDVLYHLY